MRVPFKKFEGLRSLSFPKHSDIRGTFSRFPLEFYENIGEHTYFATAFNRTSGTLRGLHSQKITAPESKVLYCTSGKIFDVVVDLRTNSNNFGNWTSINLSADGATNGIFIPPGCGHGYLTLTNNSSVIYRIDGEYKPEKSFDIHWADPQVNIKWPKKPLIVSSKDSRITNVLNLLR